LGSGDEEDGLTVKTNDLIVQEDDSEGRDIEWFRNMFFEPAFPYITALSKEIVRYIIELPSPEQKKFALWVLAEPESMKPRPAILLVSIFDDYQATVTPKTTGQNCRRLRGQHANG
jgi:hypothetical protein